MKINLSLITFVFALLFSVESNARLLNNMQSCQGVIAGIDSILAEAPDSYPSEDVKIVRTGFDLYSQFIQTDIVTPGLLKVSQGDKTKAEQIQIQVDAYKANMVKNFRKRYPENKIYMDHAVTINECTKQAVPKGQALDDLLLAFKALQKLAGIP